MCIRLTEQYAVCKCTHHVHGIDPCQSVGQHRHRIEDRTVLVGYACSRHTPAALGGRSSAGNGGGIPSPPRLGVLPDTPSGESFDR